MASFARAGVALARPLAQAPDFGAWREDHGSLSLEYSRRVMEEIRAAISRAAFGIGRGGVEIGGLLFGTRLGAFVRILGWLEIPCRHARGPSFRLDDGDREVLGYLIENRNDREDLRELQLLGWFSSHSRGEIPLTDSDVELAGQLFADPDLLTVVFKPGRFGDMEGVVHKELTALHPRLFIEPVAAPPSERRRAARREQGEQSQPAVQAPAIRPRKRNPLWAAVATAILLSSGVAGSGWLAWHSWRNVVTTAQPLQLLSLDARADGDGLLVSWNGQSERLRPGMRGLLEVHGRDYSNAIVLSQQELRAGQYSLEDVGVLVDRTALTLMRDGKIVVREEAQKTRPRGRRN